MTGYRLHLSTKRNDETQNICQVAATVVEESTYITLDVLSDSDSESDIDDDNPNIHSDSLLDTIETLLNEVEYLSDLGPRLEEPVPDCPTSDRSAPPRTPSYWDPAVYFADRVLTKFPECNSSLADALGRANATSMARLQARREATYDEGGVVNAPGIADKGTVFQDSGLGTSLPATSSYAATVVSYGGDGQTRARIPPLPVDIEIGQRFPCTACGEYVEKRDMRAWK